MNKWVLIRFACYYTGYLLFKIVLGFQWEWIIEIPVCLFYLVLSAILSWEKQEAK